MERDRQSSRLGGVPGRAREDPSLHLPARNIGDEALLAWLSEEGARLEAIENESELAVSRVEINRKPLFVPAPTVRDRVPERNPAVLQITDRRSVSSQDVAPAKR